MKKLLILFVCFAFAMGVSAMNQKEEKIPAAAKTGFAAKYPTVEKVKWSVEKPGEFEAEFKLNGVETSVLVDAKGNVLETEAEIREAELPLLVKKAIAKDFSGYKLDEIEKATDDKGVTTFEMEAAKGKDKLEISFDSNGKLLKKKSDERGRRKRR